MLLSFMKLFFLPPPPPSLPLFSSYLVSRGVLLLVGGMVFPYFTEIIPLSLPHFLLFFYNASVLFFTTLQQHATRTPANRLSSQVKSSCLVIHFHSPYILYTVLVHISKKEKKEKLYSAAVCLPDWNTKVAAAWAVIVVVFPTVMLLVFLFLHESRFECKMSCTISFTAAANQSHLLFCWLG